MKSKKLSVLLAVIALIVSTLACSFGGGEPSLTNPRMSTDSEGNSTTTVFSGSDAFYAVADLSNVETGSIVDAKWYLVSAADYRIRRDRVKLSDDRRCKFVQLCLF